MATLEVGPDKAFKTLFPAVYNAKDGDTINVISGTYSGKDAPFTVTIPNLTIKAIGGRVTLNCRDSKNNAHNVLSQGICSINNSGKTRFEKIDFIGAAIAASDGNNAAGIRLIKGDLECIDCGFYYNQDGILTSANDTGKVYLEKCHFAFNGAGDGLSHSMYIGAIARLDVIKCVSRNVKGGQTLKSRAKSGSVLYCLLGEAEPQPNGNTSFELAFPHGGDYEVKGNIVLQSTGSSNGHIVTFGEEGVIKPINRLVLNYNTIVGYRDINYFIRSSQPAVLEVTNNLIVGKSYDSNTIYEGITPAIDTGNAIVAESSTVKFTGKNDFRLLPDSPQLALLSGMGKTGQEPAEQITSAFNIEKRNSWITPGALENGAGGILNIPPVPVADPGVAVGFTKISSLPTIDVPPVPITGTKVIGLVIQMPDGSYKILNTE